MTNFTLYTKDANRRAVCPGSLRLEATVPDVEESYYEKIKRVARDAALGSDVDNVFYYPDELWQEIKEGAELFQSILPKDSHFIKHPYYTEGKDGDSIYADSCWYKLEDDILQLFYYDFSYSNTNLSSINWHYIGNTFIAMFSLMHVQKILIEKQRLNKVEITLVQPRASIKIKKLILDMLLNQSSLCEQYIANEEKAFESGALCVPTLHCKNCKAKFVCKALRDSSLQTIEAISSDSNPSSSNEELGSELRLLHHFQALLSYRITALETEATERLKNKEAIPGYALREKNKREIWSISTNNVIELGKQHGINLINLDKSVFTPKQAIKAGLDEDIVRSVSTVPPGEMELVKNDR